MKTKIPSVNYEAYVERMKKMGNVKVREITVDSQKYAEYLKRMEHNLELLEEIRKQTAKTAMLRRSIVGHSGRQSAIKYVRYLMEKDD